MVMSRNVYVPEINAAEAKALNDGIPSFNNDMSSVYEAPGFRRKAKADPLPFADDTDWTGDVSVYAAPKGEATA